MWGLSNDDNHVMHHNDSGRQNRNTITSSPRHPQSVTAHTLVLQQENRWGNWVLSRNSLAQWSNTDSVYSSSSRHNIMVVADITMHKLPHYIHGSHRLTICITAHVAHSEKTLPISSGVYVWNLLHGQEKWTDNRLTLSGIMKCRTRQVNGCTVQILVSQWRQRAEY